MTGIENLPLDLALVHLRVLLHVSSLREAFYSTGPFKGLLPAGLLAHQLSDLPEQILGSLFPPQSAVSLVPRLLAHMGLLPSCYPWAWLSRVVLGRISQLLSSVVCEYSLPLRCFTLYHWVWLWLGRGLLAWKFLLWLLLIGHKLGHTVFRTSVSKCNLTLKPAS